MKRILLSAAVVAACLAVAAVAYLGRYEIVKAGNGPAIFVVDRFTGAVQLCAVDCRAVPSTEFVAAKRQAGPLNFDDLIPSR